VRNRALPYGDIYANGSPPFGRGPHDARVNWFWSRACAFDPATNCANVGTRYEFAELRGIAQGHAALAKKYYSLACRAGNAAGCIRSR